MNAMPSPPSDFASDTLVGSEAIAAFIGKSKRQTEHLLEKRRLPAFKMGGRWHMRQSTYAGLIAQLEAKAMGLEADAIARVAA